MGKSKPLKERVRAVIIDRGNLLTIKRVKPTRTYWIFPGGGVDMRENHRTALKRECKEELGLDVTVREPLFDFIIEEPDITSHQYWYRCEVVGGILGSGSGPEFQPNRGYEGVHEIEYIPLTKVSTLNLLPLEARNTLLQKLNIIKLKYINKRAPY